MLAVVTTDSTAHGSALEAAGLAKTQTLMKSLRAIEHKRKTGGYDIETGSELDLDGERMTGLRVTHGVERALHHSLDCLWGLNQLLVVNGPQHYAPYVLIRGALESAAAAVWLLAADDQTIRLQRRVAMEINNSKEASAALRAAGINEKDSGRVERYKSALAELLHGAGLEIDDCKWTGYGAVVKEIETEPASKHSVELAWRACSGMSHGKLWSFQMFASESNRRVVDGGVFQADFSPSYHSLAMALEVAVQTIHRVDKLFDQRRRTRA